MTPDDLFGRPLSPADVPGPRSGASGQGCTPWVEGSGAVAFEYEDISRRGITAISIGSELYPERLGRLLGNSAPPLLFGVGNPSLLKRGGVAIVG